MTQQFCDKVVQDPWKYRQMPDQDLDRNWRKFSKCCRSVWIEISLFWRNAQAVFQIGIGRGEQGLRWCPDRNLHSRNVKAELENQGTGTNALAATRQWAPTAAANLFIGMCTSISFFPLLSPVLQSSFLVVWTILPWCIYFLFTLGLYLSPDDWKLFKEIKDKSKMVLQALKAFKQKATVEDEE